MQIQSSVRQEGDPQLKQYRLPKQSTGLLVGIENPPGQLADAAESMLGLPYKPNKLLVGIPVQAMPTPLEKAFRQTSLKAAQLVSKELAKATGNSVVQSGVNIFWLGLKASQLIEEWQDPGRNIPALLVDSAEVALGTLSTTLGPTDIGNSFFDNELLQADLDVLVTGLSAAAKGEDVSMSLLNSQVSSTEVGKALGLVTPVLNAAMSSSPDYSQISFKPLPQWRVSPTQIQNSSVKIGNSPIKIGTPPITGGLLLPYNSGLQKFLK